MGEQTQPQPQPQAPLQSPPETTGAVTTTTSVPPKPTSPPSKIPSRPRKIRKITPDDSATSSAGENTDNRKTNSSKTNNNKSAGAAKSKDETSNSKTTTTKSSAKASSQSRALVLAPRSLSSEGELENAIRHLRESDPILSSLIDTHPPPTFDAFHTPFLALTRSILYQQLAFKAGTSVYSRFIALCGGESGVVPETVLALNPQQLRQIGVSGRKASYLHDLARKYQNGILSDSAIVNMDDKSLFAMLTMVNGIGSWSVHMFMIFSLHRPDVLPINDLGVRKGVQMLYNLDDLPRPSQMDGLCEKWRPYRSVASWYLWRFVEAKGTPATAVAVATGVSLSQQQQQEEQQQVHEAQMHDPINSILNLGACAWEQ